MKNKLNVVTYNIWKDCGDFPARIEKMGAFLKGIDCICLQEDFTSEHFCSSDNINEILKLHKTTLPIRIKKRNEVLSSSNLTILSKIKPHTVENLIFDKQGSDERGILIIEFYQDDKNILIINTHLSNLTQERRLEQIYQIKNIIDTKVADLIILCGDMNCTPSSQELHIIKKVGFADYNNDPTYEEGIILDYILSKSNFFYKVKSKILVQNLSDHHCLQNKFIW